MRPRPAPGTAVGRPPTRSGLRTSIRSDPPSSPSTLTSTVVSGACLRALVRLSWTIRNAFRPIEAGTSSSGTELDIRMRAPARRSSSISASRSLSVGCGRSNGPGRVGVAEHAEDLPQVDERLVGVLLDHVRRPGGLLGCQVRPEGERAGVHRHQRDPVRQHVVHLAGDPRALVRASLRDPQRLLALRPFRTVAQRRQQLSPGADVETDRDRDAGREAATKMMLTYQLVGVRPA